MCQPPELPKEAAVQKFYGVWGGGCSHWIGGHNQNISKNSGGDGRASWVKPLVCVHRLWSDRCHLVTLPLISACKLYLGAGAVTCLRAVKCRRLRWHMESECNGCQTSRGWADANQETEGRGPRTDGITKYSSVWQHCHMTCHCEEWYNRGGEKLWM